MRSGFANSEIALDLTEDVVLSNGGARRFV